MCIRDRLAAIAESLVTDAERSNRRVTCLLHLISDGTRVRHAQGITLSILRAFIACAATVQTVVLVLFGPSCLGHYRPLQLLHAHFLGLLLLSVCVFSKTTCTGTKIKNFSLSYEIPKPFFKFPDKLIGNGCPTTGVLSMWNEIQRIATLHLAETLRLTALPHDSALHL